PAGRLGQAAVQLDLPPNLVDQLRAVGAEPLDADRLASLHRFLVAVEQPEDALLTFVHGAPRCLLGDAAAHSSSFARADQRGSATQTTPPSGVVGYRSSARRGRRRRTRRNYAPHGSAPPIRAANRDRDDAPSTPVSDATSEEVTGT